MSTTISFSPAAKPSLSRAAHWYLRAFRLWRRAPLAIVLLPLAGLIAEGLIQLIPWAGVVLSKVTVPMLGAGLWIGLDGLDRGERLRMACLWIAWRQPRWKRLWLVCAAVGLAVFVVQLACAWAVFGPTVVDAVLWGHMAAHPALATSALEYVLMLPGMVPATLLAFVMPCFLFTGASCRAAFAWSVATVAAIPLVFVVAMLPQVALFALALSSPWALVLFLVLQPLGTLVAFAAWRDLSAGPVRDERVVA